MDVSNYKENHNERDSEAIIPAELGLGSYKVEAFKPETNNEGFKLHLDLLQEKHDQAQITMSAYQERVASTSIGK